MSAPVKETAKIGQGKAGPGRPKGLPNKNTAMLKDALLLAADTAGGKDGLVGYLTKQAKANPGPFMALLGKVLPLQLTGDPNNPIAVSHHTDTDRAKALAAFVARTKATK